MSRQRAGTTTVVGALSLMAILLASAALTATTRSPVEPAATPSPTPTGSQVPTPTGLPSTARPVMLLQVRDALGASVGTALLAVGEAPGAGRLVVVPSDVVLDVPGQPAARLSRLPALLPSTRTQQALSDATGIRIDGALVLDRLAFAGLVDAVGGLRVTVGRQVVERDITGEVVIVVPSGDRLLDGLSIAAYATHLERGEPESVRTARFAGLLAQLLLALPDEPAGIKAIVGSLGLSARSTMPTDQVVLVLHRLAADLRSGATAATTLPTVTVPAGALEARRIDVAAAAQVVAVADRRAVGDGTPVRVLVLDSHGMPGLEARARALLITGGFAPVPGGRAGTGAARTTVEVGQASLIPLGAQVAAALGLPGTVVAVTPSGSLGIDVVVRVGADLLP